jgi:anti-anti-sigma factor
MNIATDKTENYLYVKPGNDKFDASVSSDMKAWFVQEIGNTAYKNLIFDLATVKYCDSSGLSAILVGNRLCQEKGGVFILCNVSDHVFKLIRISQLDTVLNILPTKEEAIDAVFLHEVEAQLKSDEDSAG